MKRFLAMILALALCLGLCACGGGSATEDTTPTEPTVEKVEDDGVMRILVIGHSRVMAAYVWYCGITGTDIKDCKLDPIPYDNLLDKSYGMLKKPMELTQQQKDILVESVSNAFANPYALTPSQFTK